MSERVPYPAPDRPAWIVRWFLALRPWGAVLSAFPVIWGTLLAVRLGGAEFKPALFIGALAAMLLIHHASNLINDVSDYRRGIDHEVQPSSGGLVRGWCRERDVLNLGIGMLSAGALIGLWLVVLTGWKVLLLGYVGVLSAYLYSFGPYPLKHHALGDAVIFLNFGLLGALGAWVVQTGDWSWTPMIWGVPFSLLVVAVLHANNWKDMAEDRSIGVRTVANVLGSRRAGRYYEALVLAAFLWLIGLAWIPGMWAMLIPLLTFPVFGRLLMRYAEPGLKGQREAILSLDAETAKGCLVFSVSSVAAAFLI